jgi:predicted helicase
MKRQIQWDGEKLKVTVPEQSEKHSPKDVLDGLDSIRAKLQQSYEAKVNAEEQLKRIEENIKGLKENEAEMIGFEEKCKELQLKKIQSIIAHHGKELAEKAKKDAEATIAKDPNAHTAEQKKQMPYLNYQRALGTHEKMAEHVHRSMITQHLYTEPIFENPFEEVEVVEPEPMKKEDS